MQSLKICGIYFAASASSAALSLEKGSYLISLPYLTNDNPDLQVVETGGAGQSFFSSAAYDLDLANSRSDPESREATAQKLRGQTITFMAENPSSFNDKLKARGKSYTDILTDLLLSDEENDLMVSAFSEYQFFNIAIFNSRGPTHSRFIILDDGSEMPCLMFAFDGHHYQAIVSSNGDVTGAQFRERFGHIMRSASRSTTASTSSRAVSLRRPESARQTQTSGWVNESAAFDFDVTPLQVNESAAFDSYVTPLQYLTEGNPDLQVVEAGGEGQCLFYSAAYDLDLNGSRRDVLAREVAAQELREQTVDYMVGNADFFFEFLYDQMLGEKKDFQEILAEMRLSGTQNDALVVALSQAMLYNIAIFHTDGSHLSRLYMPAHGSDDMPCLMLAYNGGHYQAIVSSNGDLTGLQCRERFGHLLMIE